MLVKGKLGHQCYEKHLREAIKKTWSVGADWVIAVGAYPGFCSVKRLGVFLLPLDGMLVHRGSLPRNLIGFPPVPIYAPGWTEALWESSVLPKNKTQFLRPGVELGPLDQGTRALTMRPPGLLERLCHVGNGMIATNTTLILIDAMFFICLFET